jgi:hypothetical protein
MLTIVTSVAVRRIKHVIVANSSLASVLRMLLHIQADRQTDAHAELNVFIHLYPSFSAFVVVIGTNSILTFIVVKRRGIHSLACLEIADVETNKSAAERKKREKETRKIL